MSAIFGILRFDGTGVSRADLDRMATTLAHSGDAARIVTAGVVGLGHRLRRVNVEDRYEAQPIDDAEADLLLVADARIDNREDLAATFGIDAATLATTPDSDLILRAYKHWGRNCAAHLLGDFAFAIWDGKSRTLLLARDHMGQRAFLYHPGPDFLAFASEAKALWALPDVPRALSERQIGRRLMREKPVGRPETMFEGIAGLSGGATLACTARGAIDIAQYWRPEPDPAHVGKDEDHYVAAWRSVLTEAIACRMRRLIDPPALSFSGGFDSGAIAALSGPALAIRGHKLIAITSVAEAERPNPRDARGAAEACAAMMPHVDLHFYRRGSDTMFTDLEQGFHATQAANGTNYVTTGVLGTARALGARLVMDGHGGDYTINIRSKTDWGLWLRQRRFGHFYRHMRGLARIYGRSLPRFAIANVGPRLLPGHVTDWWRALRRGFAPHWRSGPVNPAFARTLIADGTIDPARLRGLEGRNVTAREATREIIDMQQRAAEAGLASLAASHGLDFTRPFHDKRVVELGLAIPDTLYARDGMIRLLARRALADLYPDRLMKRAPFNDSQDPDIDAMYDDVAEDAIAQATRLSRDPHVSRYIDFAKVRSVLASRDTLKERRDRMQLAFALQAVTMARFITWFEGRNLPEDDATQAKSDALRH